MVLEGAAKLVAEARPAFYIEVAAANFEQFHNRFAAADYRVFDATGSPASQVSGANYFVIPADRSDQIALMPRFSVG